MNDVVRPVMQDAVAAAPTRVDGRDKVTGRARYAVEHPVEDVVWAWPVTSTVAKGRVTEIDASEANGTEGVLAVLTHANAPRLGETDDAELRLLQSDRVAYRGQVCALVVGETVESARAGADAVRVRYDEAEHDVVLDARHPAMFTPEKVNPGFPTDTSIGDPDTAFAGAAVQVDATYTTPTEHNHAMEPHATTASWGADGTLTLYDSNQGSTGVARVMADLFGLQVRAVHVISEHVGGGFGSKGTPRPNIVLAAMAAQAVGRPVRLALGRQHMFSLVGYRTPTIQRLRLGASTDGVLLSLVHDVWEQTSTLDDFAEQTAVISRMLYAAPARRTTHRLVRLDVPTPSWMRAPGEAPGSFALESAMDELAAACDLDPVELRVRNEPDVDPESGNPFSSRNLVACLREGARRFGWEQRDPTPCVRRDGRWLVGTGVASSTYPARTAPSQARVSIRSDGVVTVEINAVDIGTGSRTALTQIAAEAMDLPADRVRLRIGDSTLPPAMIAGGSMGLTSWGSAIVKGARQLRELVGRRDGAIPEDGLEVTADTAEEVRAVSGYARHAFGAQFCEVRVDADTGEVRVPRLLGVFAVGRVINARTARSQLVGGMTMGLSMALHEEGLVDVQHGDNVNHDLAGYHMAANADVADVDAMWLEEHDEHLNLVGAKGIGEIGIVGTAAAVANAVHHATGVRVRDLPIRVDRLLGRG
ncbi:MAG: xanthine dehydrogenase YagR molybdenum-binding subunit [Actinomycetota bacterium]|nr:xanthine dehydrogenase YagR molybdenum-binding subunit [Actinomycetota bacterium]